MRNHKCQWRLAFAGAKIQTRPERNRILTLRSYAYAHPPSLHSTEAEKLRDKELVLTVSLVF